MRALLAVCLGFMAVSAEGAPLVRLPADLAYVGTIEVTKQTVDLDAPWRRKRPTVERHMAAKASKESLVTTALAVADATFIVFQVPGALGRVTATVQHVDYEANLALLRLAEPAALDALATLTFGPDAAAGEEVTVVGLDADGKMRASPARVAATKLAAVATSSYEVPLLRIDAAGVPTGRSDIVVGKRGFAGIVDERTANGLDAIPASLVERYVEDAADGIYRGGGDLGVALRPLDSPVLRELHGLTRVEGGVGIARVYAGGSAEGALAPGDVLLELDGRQVDAYGRVAIQPWGEIGVQAVAARHTAGETVAAKILRGDKTLEVEVALRRPDSNRFLVPRYRYGGKEPHLIVGGLVFQELTIPFLTTWGATWRSAAPVRLARLASYANPAQSGEPKRVVILNRVLADAGNHGYEDLASEILAVANGREIHSLEDLERALRDAPIERYGRQFIQLKLAGGQGEVILSYDGLEAQNRRLAEVYGVNDPASFFWPAHSL